jgi:hypothetical protein
MKKFQDIDLKKGINYSQMIQWLYIPLKKTGLLYAFWSGNFSLIQFLSFHNGSRETDSMTLVNYNGDHLYSTYEILNIKRS